MIFNIFLHLAFVSTEQDEVQAKRRRTEKKVCQKFKQNNKRTESKEELPILLLMDTTYQIGSEKMYIIYS